MWSTETSYLHISSFDFSVSDCYKSILVTVIMIFSSYLLIALITGSDKNATKIIPHIAQIITIRNFKIRLSNAYVTLLTRYSTISRIFELN